MALRTVVKINAVRNLSDARYCAGMMVDYLGFCFDPSSKDYISPVEFTEIASWTSGVGLVAELGSMSVKDSIRFLEQFPISVVESESIEVLVYAKEKGMKTIYRCFEDSRLADFQPDIYLVNSLTISPDLSNPNSQWLYNGPLQITEIDMVLAAGWHGLALRSSEEIKPGLSTFGELIDILESLEIE